MEIKIKKVGKNLNVFYGEETFTIQSPSKELVEEIKTILEKYNKLKSKTTGTAIKLAEKIKELSTPKTVEVEKEKVAKKEKIVAEKKLIKKKKELAEKEEPKGKKLKEKSTKDLIAELSSKDNLSKEEVDELQKLLDKYKEEKKLTPPPASGNYGRREY
jgi:hypothetical protein